MNEREAAARLLEIEYAKLCAARPLGRLKTVGAIRTQIGGSSGYNRRAHNGEMTESGRMCLPAKEVWAQAHRGFKSHSLRVVMSQDIGTLRTHGSEGSSLFAAWLETDVGVQDQCSEKLSGCAVDDPNVEVVDEENNRRANASGSDPQPFVDAGNSQIFSRRRKGGGSSAGGLL